MSGTALSLYELEDGLAALLNSEDLIETDDQRQQFDEDLQEALLRAVEKRDAVAGMLAYCEHQQRNAALEIKRLEKFSQAYERIQKRVENCVLRTILDFGEDAKGRYCKLAGRTSVLSIRQCPEHVVLTDEAAIPAAFKTLTIKVPAQAFEEFLDAADVDEGAKFLAAVRKTECAIDKDAVKRAITPDAPVPGAELGRNWNVVRK